MMTTSERLRAYSVWCEEGRDALPVDSMDVWAISERDAIRKARKAWGISAADARRAGYRYRAAEGDSDHLFPEEGLS